MVTVGEGVVVGVGVAPVGDGSTSVGVAGVVDVEVLGAAVRHAVTAFWKLSIACFCSATNLSRTAVAALNASNCAA